ncbi:Uncharacterised protein [Klebsiella pneumoniae]|nr:Uncharacterised protein [Klebsiella pneumoniae]
MKKAFFFFILFITYRNEVIKTVISLIQPIVVGIWCDFLPAMRFLNTVNTAKIGNRLQLFFFCQVITNIMKINLTRLCCYRIFYQNSNYNRRSCSLTKNVIFFLAANLS